MHVHLPKAFHGWRELAKEVGIIVLGVLIALGFEQIVQAWHWHEEAKQTRDALAREIGYSALWAQERLAVEQCLRRRIAYLTSKLNSERAEWAADPVVLGEPRNPIGNELQTIIPLAYRAPHRPWLSDEWQTAKSSGIIDHFDRNDARNIEFIYRNIEQLDSLQNEEASLEPQVSFLSFNQALQPQSRVQALVTLARLDFLNGMQVQSARQMLSTARSVHLPDGPIVIGQHAIPFEAARNRIVVALRSRYGRCVIDPPEK
jgi:hypothetical protein